jgi:hypothetical protein
MRPPPRILPPLLRSYVPSSPSPLPAFPAMGRRRVTADELLARAEANGYKKGKHKEKDAVRNRHKHVDNTKKDQNMVLDRYVL